MGKRRASIADCYREIELEFEIYSERRRQNSLHKLDTLSTALNVFRAGPGRSEGSWGAGLALPDDGAESVMQKLTSALLRLPLQP